MYGACSVLLAIQLLCCAASLYSTIFLCLAIGGHLLKIRRNLHFTLGHLRENLRDNLIDSSALAVDVCGCGCDVRMTRTKGR